MTDQQENPEARQTEKQHFKFLSPRIACQKNRPAIKECSLQAWVRVKYKRMHLVHQTHVYASDVFNRKD